MAEKILSWKVITPGRNLEIPIENDRDIGSTKPVTYERVKAVGRSVARTEIMIASNIAYMLSIMEAAKYLRGE